MKKTVVRIISVLLLLSMLVCFAVSCKKDEAVETAPVTNNTVSTDGEEVLELPFDQTNYGREVTVLYTNSGTIQKNFYFDEATEAGEVIKEALFERRALVQDYIGVDVKGVAESGEYADIFTIVSRDALANDDKYQIVLTHVYLGLGNLLGGGYLHDLYEMEDISLNEAYWNVDAMENLEVGGKAYFGSSDYLIPDVCAVYFNKTMKDTYQISEDLYDLVREGEWTLEKFMELGAKVAVDNGELQDTKEGIYGLGVRADWEFLPLIDSCEVEWVIGSGYKTLNMGSSNEKYLSVYEWVEKLADAEWSYMYNYGDKDNKVTIANGNCLFVMESLKSANEYLGSGVSFGILPYPKYDTDQEEYHTLDAGGLMCVPISVKDDDIEMVAKTLECLSFYSADTVHVAYYERLLGARVADAVDDAEMLSEYIFGTISLNPVYNYQEKANAPLGILVYTIPKMLRAKLNGTTIDTIATNWASNRKAAQEILDKTINLKSK